MLVLNTLSISFIRDTLRMRKLIATCDVMHSQNKNKNHFLVVVTPWMGTGVPWFSLVCGLFLDSSGNKVTFVIDDIPFGEVGLRFRLVLGCIKSVLRMLRTSNTIIYLSKYISSDPLTVTAKQSIYRLADLNAVWSLRGEMILPGRDRYRLFVIQQLSISYGAITNVLKNSRYDCILVPGGIWGSSGIWFEKAKAAGVRAASFDSGGFGTLMLAVNGVASQLQDIPRAFSLLKNNSLSPEEYLFIHKEAQAEITRRYSGVDKFSSQLKICNTVNADYEGAVLIALNSSWDSAALGLHMVFENNTQWIIETVRFILNTTDVSVVVRQHPAERFEVARTTDNYKDLLIRHFGRHPRLHFIAADDPVNSYDLLEQVGVVVAYTSTIGIEAAVRGKVVVTEASSYYSNLGFVWKASSLEQYQQYLTDAVMGKYVVTKSLEDDALCCYYLTQCCNWVFSPFNPEGFAEWSLYDLDRLKQNKKVQITIQALEHNIPVAYLNHLAMFANKSDMK